MSRPDDKQEGEAVKGARLFLEAAKRHGVDKVFGIVGGEANAILFNEVPGIDFYLTRHEFVAGIAADVYARMSGKMQMCYSTFGPGLTNMLTGVASAMLDRSPMLAVSAQLDQSDIVYNVTHQCLDNAAILRPMTKFSHELTTIEEIPEIVATASAMAKAEMPGPAYISFPRNIMAADLEDTEAHRLLDAMKSSEPPPPPSAPRSELDWIAEQIQKARKPVALGGNVIFREGAVQEVREFLEAWQVPVISSLASKGLLPEDHPLMIGAVNKYLDGILHDNVLDQIFGDCDLMILLGFDYGEDVKPVMWMRNPNQRTIMLGPHPNLIEKVHQPARVVVGGMKSSLSYLATKATQGRSCDTAFIQRLKAKKAASGENPINEYPTVAPQAIVRAVRDAIGPDGIFCTDIGLHKQYNGLFSSTYEPNTFICSNGTGTFGFGLPAGIGAKLAFPDRRVAVVCGDGGFHSTNQDLETAVRYKIPIVIIMMKDNSFGLIKYYQLSGQNQIHSNAVDFGDIDFVKLAQAQGFHAAFVTSRQDLKAHLAEAFARNRPTLLEVPVRYQYRF
jgi:N2-(2-carboxyethyl)arginine synthase